MADSKDDGTTPVHWTRRPGGREKLSRAIRRGLKAKRAAARSASNHKPSRKTKPHASRRYAAASDASASPSSNHRIAPDLVAYALGRIEGFIEHYARSAGVSESALTAELGAILYGKGGR